MNILDTILNSQGGQTVEKIASQFGLNTDQARETVQNLVPTLVNAAKSAISQPGGLQKLQDILQNGGHQEYLQNLSQAFSADGIAKGRDAVTSLLGGSEAVNQIVTHLADKTGVAADKINDVLPGLANLVMGVFAKVQASPVGDLMNTAMNSPLGKMMGGLLGGGQAEGGGNNPLAAVTTLLENHNVSSIADDLLGKLFKR